MKRCICLGLLVVLCLLSVAAVTIQWRERRRQGVNPSRRAAELVGADEWPAEPMSPTEVSAELFADALRKLCGYMPKGRAERYAEWIIQHAQTHGEDPFLIGAIMYRMSRCKPDAENSEGVGLTGIQSSMFRDNTRGRYLRYSVPTGGGFEDREVELSRVLSPQMLRNAEANLEWAAALLAMMREQHSMIDRQFEQEPHRHYVSHFIWGDRVTSSRSEDRILTDRRRLLGYYGLVAVVPQQYWRGVLWQPPLDGGLRVISGIPGDPRDGGARAHRGVDVESCFGEPVYAMAEGTVSFAGVDLPGRGTNEQLHPTELGSVPRKSLGAGGRFVCVTHPTEGPGWIRSCYMHLERTYVVTGDEVKAGQRLGTVGRTGMRSSAPHLHLELQSDTGIFNAREILHEVFLGDPPPIPRVKRGRAARAHAGT